MSNLSSAVVVPKRFSQSKRIQRFPMDSAGMLKLGSKVAEPVCEANTELKLRSAWQRRNLAMDLAGLATFSVMEGWTQLLFSHLLRESTERAG